MMKFVPCLVAILALGCSKEPPDQAQLRADEITLVQATVAEPARVERLLALLDERDRLIEETVTMLREYKREIKALNADFDAQRDVVVEIIDYYNRERALKQLRFIDLIAQMKSATTAEEWALIADFQLQNLNPRQLVYQPLAGGA
ncbi:MAG: hypothetical protein OEU50_16340 [Gammaproteobacteria bacterium]|nr:hypothetical protein [Gammaproteobacteria bacterium]